MRYSYDRRGFKRRAIDQVRLDQITEVSNRHFALQEAGWAELDMKDARTAETMETLAAWFPEAMEYFRRRATIEFSPTTRSGEADLYIDDSGVLRMIWKSRHPIVDTKEEAQELARVVEAKRDAARKGSGVSNFEATMDYERTLAKLLGTST